MISIKARKAAVILISLLACHGYLSAQHVAWGQVAWNDPVRKDKPEDIKIPLVYPIAGGVAVLGGGAYLLLKDSDDDEGPAPTDTIEDCGIAHQVTTEPAICNTATGSVQISPAEDGVTATWPDGLEALERDDLQPGSYTVTLATDSCTRDITVDIGADNIELQLVIEQATDPSSPGAMDGNFVVILENAKAPPFTFSLNQMTFEPSPEPVFSQGELNSGEYIITVMDDRGCEGEVIVILGDMGILPHDLDLKKSGAKIRVIWIPWSKLYPAPNRR